MRSNIVAVVLIVFGLGLSAAAAEEPKAGAEARTILQDGKLYKDLKGKEEAAGGVKAGSRIVEVREKRTSRWKVTLEDGRKGWVRVSDISFSAEDGAKIVGDIQLQDKPDIRSALILPQGKQKAVTPVKILERKPGWVRVEIPDGTTGWILNEGIDIDGQIPDSVLYYLWIPLDWLNSLLGGGFLSGVVFLLLYIIPPVIGFFIAYGLSLPLKFLPNIVLQAVMALTTLYLYATTFFTVLFVSPYGRTGVGNMLTMALFVVLTVGVSAGVLKADFRMMKKKRCPSCKAWKGRVADMEHLGTTTTTTTTTYTNGGKARATSSVEDWKNYCVCGACGHEWNVYEKIRS